MKSHQIVRLGIGRTFQTATVFEQLRCCRTSTSPAACTARRLDAARAAWVPTASSGAGDDRPHRPGDRPAGVLAHGQKQWLEIGMLLVQDAQVMFLDEPVAGMSAEERDETGELLQRIGADRTIVVIEHDMDFMRSFADVRDRACTPGKVLAEGTVAEIQADPKVQEVYLGPRRRRRRMADADARDRRRDRRATAARWCCSTRRPRRPAGGAVAVMGHNGAGKTTLLRVAVGLIPVKSGAVLLDGEDVTKLAPQQRRAARHRLRPAGPALLPADDDAGEPPAGLDRSRSEIDEVLDTFPALTELLDRRPDCSPGASASSSPSPDPAHQAADADPRRADRGHPAQRRREIEQVIVELTQRGDLTVLLVEQHVGFALRSTSLLRARVGSHHRQRRGWGRRPRRRPRGDGGVRCHAPDSRRHREAAARRGRHGRPRPARPGASGSTTPRRSLC